MKKVTFLFVAVAMVFSMTSLKAQKSSSNEIQLIPLRLKAEIQSVPYQLQSQYANGTIDYTFCYTQNSRGCLTFEKAYNGTGNYYAYTNEGVIPAHSILTIDLYVTTKPLPPGPLPIVWWVGKARNDKYFQGYQSLYTVTINETDFYSLERKGGIIDDIEKEIR